jgi:hypothetical protein
MHSASQAVEMRSASHKVFMDCDVDLRLATSSRAAPYCVSPCCSGQSAALAAKLIPARAPGAEPVRLTLEAEQQPLNVTPKPQTASSPILPAAFCHVPLVAIARSHALSQVWDGMPNDGARSDLQPMLSEDGSRPSLPPWNDGSRLSSPAWMAGSRPSPPGWMGGPRPSLPPSNDGSRPNSSVSTDWAFATLLAISVASAVHTVWDLNWPSEVDIWREMGRAYAVLDGYFWSDHTYAGEVHSRPPLLPGMIALLSLATGAPVHVLYARSGPLLNLLGPITFYLFVRRMLDRRVALAAATGMLVMGAASLGSPLRAAYSPFLLPHVTTAGIFFLTLLSHTNKSGLTAPPHRLALPGMLWGRRSCCAPHPA